MCITCIEFLFTCPLIKPVPHGINNLHTHTHTQQQPQHYQQQWQQQLPAATAAVKVVNITSLCNKRLKRNIKHSLSPRIKYKSIKDCTAKSTAAIAHTIENWIAVRILDMWLWVLLFSRSHSCTHALTHSLALSLHNPSRNVLLFTAPKSTV